MSALIDSIKVIAKVIVHHELSFKWPQMQLLSADPVLVRAAANYFDFAPIRQLLFPLLLLKRLYLLLLQFNELIGSMQSRLHF